MRCELNESWKSDFYDKNLEFKIIIIMMIQERLQKLHNNLE